MRRAFTMVELIVVIGIIGLLAALVMPSFGVWRERTVVRSAARDIESILKLARSKSLASEDGAKYGVLLYDQSTPDAFQLCQNPISSPLSCGTIIDTYQLHASLSLCPLTASSGGVSSIVFSKLTGAPDAPREIYFYNTHKIASPCSDAALITACLAAKTCGGVVVTKDGVIYEK